MAEPERIQREREQKLLDFVLRARDEENARIFTIEEGACDAPTLYSMLGTRPELLSYFITPRYQAGPVVPKAVQYEVQWRAEGPPRAVARGAVPPPPTQRRDERRRKGADAPATRDGRRLVPIHPAEFLKDRERGPLGDPLQRYVLGSVADPAPVLPTATRVGLPPADGPRRVDSPRTSPRAADRLPALIGAGGRAPAAGPLPAGATGSREAGPPAPLSPADGAPRSPQANEAGASHVCALPQLPLSAAVISAA